MDGDRLALLGIPNSRPQMTSGIHEPLTGARAGWDLELPKLARGGSV